MKPVWTQTLAWIAAALLAFLFALGTPDGVHFATDVFSQGSEAPR